VLAGIDIVAVLIMKAGIQRLSVKPSNSLFIAVYSKLNNFNFIEIASQKY